MRVLRLTSIICALALAAAGMTFAGAAAAKPGETVFFEAPRDLLGVPGATRLATIDKLQSLGVHALRIVLYWRDVAPHAELAHAAALQPGEPVRLPVGQLRRRSSTS